MNIYDIAEKSGVSIATVSRIINKKGNVSPKTEQKVLKVMDEMGYTPNAFARALGLNSIKMIGVVCTDVSDVYYAKAVSVIENELRVQGYDAFLYCTGTDLKNKKKAIDLLLSKRVDAIILIGSDFQEPNDNSHIEKAAEFVPVVIINGELKIDNVYSVRCDESQAIKEGVQALIDKGHKDILYVYTKESFSAVRKKNGYIAAMKSANLSYTDRIFKCDQSFDCVKKVIDNAISENIKFSAVITSVDILAVGTIKALIALGLDVPKDVSVLGFNNSILAKCSTPSISSIDSKVEILCTDAVRTLIDVFDKKNVSPIKTIQGELVYQESFIK